MAADKQYADAKRAPGIIESGVLVPGQHLGLRWNGANQAGSFQPLREAM